MKLITETADFQSMKVEVLTESTTGGKSHYITGPFLQAIDRNRNGRIYGQEILEREVLKLNEEKIPQNRLTGELEHPTGPQINLDRISHLITELEMDGKYGIGKAKLLETPCGKVAISLLEGGVQLGVSTRGMGSLEEGDVVGDDFDLITVDIVADPSAPDAWVNGIMEAKQWVLGEGGIYTEASKQKGMSKGDVMEKAYDTLETEISALTLKESKIMKESLTKFINKISLV